MSLDALAVLSENGDPHLGVDTPNPAINYSAVVRKKGRACACRAPASHPELQGLVTPTCIRGKAG